MWWDALKEICKVVTNLKLEHQTRWEMGEELRLSSELVSRFLRKAGTMPLGGGLPPFLGRGQKAQMLEP